MLLLCKYSSPSAAPDSYEDFGQCSSSRDGGEGLPDAIDWFQGDVGRI
jgi:hypothetical protein